MEFVEIRGFKGYSVSIDGVIRNDRTGRFLVQTYNGHGVVQVGLMRNGVQVKRGVALIVARTFLDPPALEAFDTPIHIDGDKFNNRLINLMWRPRWFAIKYSRQFEYHAEHGPMLPIRLIELNTRMKFKDSWDAAIRFGLLEREVCRSVNNRHWAWPTYQKFRVYDERRRVDRV